MLSALYGPGRLRVAMGLVFVPLLVLASFCGAQDVRKAAQTQPATQPASRPAEPKIAVPQTAQTTEQEILARIQQTQGAEGIKEDERKAVLALYKRALEQIRSAKEFSEKAAACEQEVKDAPQRLRALKEAASRPATQPAVDTQPALSLAEMEAKLKQYQLELSDLEKKAGELAAELKDRQARRAQLPRKLTEAQDKLKDIQDKLAKLAASAEPQRVKDAQQALLNATQRALQAEIAACQKEVATYEIRGSLLRAQQEAIARRVARRQAAVKAWQAAVQQRRDEEGRRQLAEARRREREAAQKHLLVQRITRKNTDLAELRAGPEGLAQNQKRATEALETAKARREKLEKSFQKIRNMVAEGVSSDLIAILLRQQRLALPDVRQFRRSAAKRRDAISSARAQLLELNELAEKCTDVATQAEQMVARADPPVPQAQRQNVLEEVRKALADRKELLAPLIKDYEAYSNSLLELNTAEKKLIAVAEEFADYIDERILWTRSTSRLSVSDLRGAWSALAWLGSGTSWRALPGALWRGVGVRPVAVVLAVIVLGGLLVWRRRLTAALLAAGSHGTGRRAGEALNSLRALVLTGALAVVAPMAMWIVGWCLCAGGTETIFAFALGQGLRTTAAVWLPLALLRQICRRKGLGEMHFRWPADGLRRIRRSLLVLAAMSLPLVFLLAVVESQDVQAHKDSLGRLALMVLLVAAAVCLGRLLRPRGPLVRNTLAARKRRWIYRLRFVWYSLVVAAPPAVAAAAAAGYYYTAVQLSGRLLMQVWIIVGLIVLHALLGRWILTGRRGLALRALAKRKQDEQPVEGQDQQIAARAAVEAAKDELDVSAVDAQTHQFIRYLLAVLLLAGIYAVWADVLPALGILRRVPLWSIGADGARQSVTLADLAWSIVVVVLTVAAARNIPGILEITLLQRLRVEAGARYAVNHLARYVISVVGVVVAFHLVGVRWNHVQWLVAAMTVGLGFGLQEIFGNFVSGLILLFERPIRVGDVVTVGDTTGTVTRIRIRATTITNWDRKELVVPNKEFVTGRLVNWTLSDNVIRIVIPVGIAYGSDTALAKMRMVEVAKAHEHVLADPAPYAIFTGFGSSSLNFELRVYVDGLDNYLAVLNDMHMNVDQAFREAGIEIAFPQQDIHIRSIKAALPLAGAERPPDEPPGVVEPPPGL